MGAGMEWSKKGFSATKKENLAFDLLMNVDKNYDTKMLRLKVGQSYWINCESSKTPTSKEWQKFIYIGECGYDNKLLMFYKVYDYNQNKGYKVSFIKHDYLINVLQILTVEEYKKVKSNNTWNTVYKVLNDVNGNGKDGYVI